MEQQPLFDETDLPKAPEAPEAPTPPKELPDPPHMAFMFQYKGADIALTPQDCRALFNAIGNFLHTVETVKNGRR